MNVSINGKEYTFVSNAIKDADSRESYFNLIRNVFGLDFKPWYQSGFCKNSFIPYTLFRNGVAVSSVGIVVNDFIWHDTKKKYIQISTVATDPDYRKNGLSNWLMETALKEWKEKCDCIYLYANDSVVDFYPKFGFSPAHEYMYHISISKTDGKYRKLDLSIKEDVDLLIRKHKSSNPFSLLTMDDDIDILMFHCISFLHNNIYYIEKYDAVIIAEQENSKMFCYDIYTKNHCETSTLLGIIAADDNCAVSLGFTPKAVAGYIVEKTNEENTTFFVLNNKENILADNKVTFPFLSRA
jgi:GNAT superfamily N-acetyltransferase